MVSQKYRWDFIGLSTDTKPTSETSEKVVNGSTYYCSDTSKLYVYCDGTWYERKPLGGGGGGGTSDFNDLSNRPKYNGSDMTGSTNIPEVKTYTAGDGIDITNAIISATNTGKAKVLTTDDYNYPVDNPTEIAAWLLPDGTYEARSTSVWWSTRSSNQNFMFIKGTTSTNSPYVLKFNSVGAYLSLLSNEGSYDSTNEILLNSNVMNSLTSSSTSYPLAANQGKVLNDKITPSTGASAPTTSTTGTLGKIYIDSSTDNAYICTKVDGNTYTWKQITT